ncbi:MAG TPA: YfhO family protein [bacterium]|nr:YfhO family protein [bacterium]
MSDHEGQDRPGDGPASGPPGEDPAGKPAPVVLSDAAPPISPRLKIAMEAAAVCGLALVCVFLLYGPRWLSGLSIFRGAIQEQYYLLGQYAFDHQIVEEFREGYFPLWNPMNGLGTPLLGNMLCGALYPLKPIVYVWSGLAARDFYIVLRLLMAALFTFALAKKLRLAFPAAAVAAISFAFTGYMKMFVNENYLNADVLLPAAVLLTLRLKGGRKIRDVVLLGLVTFAVLNNGHPEAAFYTLLLPALLAAAASLGPGRARMTAPLFAAGVGAGVMLSLPMILPFLEYWFRGYHFHVPGTGFFHYSARQAVALWSPWFFGKAPAGAPFLTTPHIVWPETLAGMPAYAESSVPWLIPALGAVPLLLAMIAVSKPRELGRTDLSLFAYALFFLGVMFGLPLFRLIGYVPVFAFSGNFKHPEPGVALCIALLAGRGLQEILRGRVSGTRAANVLVVTLIAVMAMGVIYEPLPGGAGFINKYSGTVLIILTAAGAWLTWSAYQLSGKGKSGGLNPAMRSAIVLLAGSLSLAAVMACLVLDGLAQPMRDPGYEKRISAGGGVARLEDLQPLSRVYISQDISPPNLNILFGLADIRVMDGVNDRRLVEAVNRINGHDRAAAGTYWYKETGYLQPMPDMLKSPLLQLFNVGYALMDGPLPYNRAMERALEQGFVLAPGPGYVGRARFPIKGGSAPGLLTHPPSKIVWDGGGDDHLAGGTLLVHFRPALITEAVAKETDGLWLMVGHGRGIAYARYLHPRRQPTDADVDFVLMGLSCAGEGAGGGEIVLSSLPGASNDYDQAGWADLRAGGPEEFDPGPWQELTRGETWLYHNPEALPRVSLVRGLMKLEGDGALTELADGVVDPRQSVIIEDVADNAGPGREASAGLPGRISAVNYSSQRIGVDAELWDPGRLLVADLYYPGWRALVDGKEERIERADYCLRSVELLPGRHEVQLLYAPASFRLGLWAMIGTLLSMAGMVLGGAAPKRKPMLNVKT